MLLSKIIEVQRMPFSPEETIIKRHLACAMADFIIDNFKINEISKKVSPRFPRDKESKFFELRLNFYTDAQITSIADFLKHPPNNLNNTMVYLNFRDEILKLLDFKI